MTLRLARCNPENFQTKGPQNNSAIYRFQPYRLSGSTDTSGSGIAFLFVRVENDLKLMPYTHYLRYG